MSSILYFVIFYVSFLIIWLVICLISYAISFLTKKNITVVPFILNTIISNGLMIWLFIWALVALWNLFRAGEWLLLVLALVFGSFIIGFYSWVIQILLYPFSMMTIFFVSKADESVNKEREYYEAEIISPDGKKVERKIASEDLIKKKLSIWFLVSYGLVLFYDIISPDQHKGWGFGDYILMPMITVLLLGGFVTVLVFAYYFLFRRHLKKTKAERLAISLRTFSVIYGFLLFLQLIYSL